MELEMGRELCRLLAAALHGRKPDRMPGSEKMQELLEFADRHSLLPLLYGIMDEKSKQEAAYSFYNMVCEKSRQTVQQSYHLLFLTRFVVRTLEESGIPSMVLKGCAAAEYYPVPELRKSGDVDLLLKNEEAAENACRCLEAHGFRRAEVQHANHHLVCVSPDQIGVELHMTLAEPFDEQRVNDRLVGCQAEFFRHSCEERVMGISLPVPERPYLAFHLLLHMLQHFLRAGFGLKLLCDWVAFWERGCRPEEEQTFLRLVRENGMEGFCGMVTAFSVFYLGLTEEKVSFLTAGGSRRIKHADLEEFLSEILEAEEFGKSSQERMVALRGTRVSDFLREFHHQTLLTYPKAGKRPVLYPVYWVRMFSGFLYRNRRLRGVSSSAVLKKAAKRGRLVEKMHIFEED